MIIFLYGKDTYRMEEKMKEIVEHYKKVHKSGLNLKYFDVFSDFEDNIKQTSMFKEKKLVIINDLFSNSEFKERFSEKKKDFLGSEDIILIYQEKDFIKSDSLYKFLKKNIKSQEFELLTGAKLRSWVKKEFEKYNSEINPEALDLLIEYSGNDLWRMNNEIMKLVNYKNKEIINKKDINLLIRSKIETDIFKTIDAIAEKNKSKALKLIHKHLEKGDSPLYLFSMINYQFRNLLIVKDFIEKCRPYGIILEKSGLHPYVVKKSYSQSYKFSFQELKKIYQKIFEIDFQIKTGKIEPEAGLDLFIAELG
ncbi:MAG: DNA polymerase III subunit delta [Candidatus Nealsonbacteria bacterium RBG_13_37_56]|uniref:DNA-directed DNA polymerase n=1 Tax=Candidatus Nealsonbacteria bacterium RBG_13_37_56 TaxID=1801661 RepID=A0A1G2DVI1_9BACT|nr:MAG: DNA polymerase III subunit delta [Candidatus Nealsonbacteria bacterium RBG_13_37_56]